MSNVFQKYAEFDAKNKFDFSSNAPTNETIENTSEPKNLFQREAEKQKEKDFSFLEIAQDVVEQAITKGISGFGGAYGNILEGFGLQAPEGYISEGQKAVSGRQFDILAKQERGEPLSLAEIYYLGEEEYPALSRFATSKEIEKDIAKTTGIGEGKTSAGRIAGQGAKFLGEGAAFGAEGKVLGALTGSGLAGQGLREADAPEAAASAVEILGSLLPSIITKKLAPAGKAVKDIVQSGRKLGLSEAQITPLIQSEGKAAVVSKVARKGTKTKKLFASIKETLGNSYDTIKGNPRSKVKLPNAEQINLRKEFSNIRNELSKTLAPSPEKQAALDYIETALTKLRNVDVTPEHLVNFWQDINKSVKWNSINGGKKALTQLKEPVSNVLKKVSPQLAEDFELTNQLYSKYAQISKKLKPDLVDSFVNKGEILTAIPSGLALAYGNPLPLMSLGGEVATRLLAREMLINPYFQNISNKLVQNFNQGSLKGVKDLVVQVKEYMTRKYPNEKWEFLVEPSTE